MVVQIKSPNPDAIWESWKNKAYRNKKKKFEKSYKVKGAAFSLSNITAAEYVKGVYKEAALYLEKQTKTKPVEAKSQQEESNWRKLDRNKFYEFNGVVNKDQWKNSDIVPVFSSISKKQCSKCSGRGYNEVKKKCSNCDKGRFYLKLDIYNENNDRIKKDYIIKCPECYGTGFFQEKEKCRHCEGTGTLYQYKIEPVPFKRTNQSEPIFYSSVKLSGIEKSIGYDIQKALSNVGGIKLDRLDKQIDVKFIEPNLGYMNKGIKSMTKSGQKLLKQASKDKDMKIYSPAYLFPVIRLECETKKGKKYQVYSIGSDEKFLVFGDL